MRHLVSLLIILSLTCGAYAQGRDDVREHDMKELTVKPKRQRYRRKGNPAVELMRKVIAAKGEHDIKKNDFYKYYRYQRMTFAFNNITQQMADSMRLLQRPLFKRQVEWCEQTGKYILPFSYNETASMHLYRREPKKERNYVLATNTEGLTEMFQMGDMFNTVLKSIFTDVNVYDDVITLLERKFTSPLSSRAAISFFQFFIQDTVMVDGEKVIRLNFVPQNPQDFGFSGWINILADSTWRVQQCTLHLPLRSSVNYVNNLVLQQQYTTIANGQRVISKDDLFAELGILKSQRMMMVHRATNYSAYSTDSLAEVQFLPSDQRRQGTANQEDEQFWHRYRTDTLSAAERNLKGLVQGLQENSKWRVPVFLLKTVAQNYLETARRGHKNYFDIGPVNTLASHNFIDGWRLRLGGQTTANLHPKLFLKGYTAYGIDSRKWYGMAQGEWSFLRKQYSSIEYPRHSIMVQYLNDVVSPSDLMWQNRRDKDNVFVSMKTSPVDHMQWTRQWTAAWELETNRHLDLKLSWKNATWTPCGALFYRRLDGEMVDQLRTAEITAFVRWAPGEEVINTKQRRRVINHNNPAISVAHTFGLSGICGADYHYNLSEITAYKRLWLYSYGRIDMNLNLGAQWSRVPFPLLVMPVANNSYIITRGMFSMINNLEFINDRYVSFDAEWDLSGKLLNRIPLIKHLKLREVIGFKALYGHLTDRNNPDMNPGAHDLFEFPSRNGECIVHPMGSTPYMELNVGLHNILKIIRIDYVRRLNYLNYPGVKKHGVRFCIDFDF